MKRKSGVWTPVTMLPRDTDRLYALADAGVHWCLRLLLLFIVPTAFLAGISIWLAWYGIGLSLLVYASAVGTVLTVAFFLGGLGCGIVRAILPGPSGKY